MNVSQRGFTLVELIVVIVILGILAATALPRFVNLGGDARVAALQGVAASMEAAKQLVQAKWLAAGSATLNPVDIGGGVSVAVVTGRAGVNAIENGFPTGAAAGMGAAITVPTGVTCTGTNPLTCEYTGRAGCNVTYTDTGAVSVVGTAATCT